MGPSLVYIGAPHIKSTTPSDFCIENVSVGFGDIRSGFNANKSGLDSVKVRPIVGYHKIPSRVFTVIRQIVTDKVHRKEGIL